MSNQFALYVNTVIIGIGNLRINFSDGRIEILQIFARCRFYKLAANVVFDLEHLLNCRQQFLLEA